MALDIPIDAAKRIARKYGYDQIIIVGRKVGPKGAEHVTTYGVDKEHCEVAARTGDFLKYKIMGWRKAEETPEPAPVKPTRDSFVGSIVEVHFIVALGPDLWVPAKVLHMNDWVSFEVETVRDQFPGGYTRMVLRNEGQHEKPQQWRKA